MFNKFVMRQPNHPLTQADIDKAEALIGGGMPPEYWAWMKLHNGGGPDRAVFQIPSEKKGLILILS